MRAARVFGLALFLGCSGGVDRTPPKRNADIPPVPARPGELKVEDEAPPDIKSIGLAIPSGCRAMVTRGERRLLSCTVQPMLMAPAGWSHTGRGRWQKGDLILSQSVRQQGADWRVLQVLNRR